MAFTPKTWVDDQIVYAEDMNRIEQGVAQEPTRQIAIHDKNPEAHPPLRKSIQKAQDDATQALRLITGLTHTIDVVPSPKSELTYSGSPQTPQWDNYDPETLTLSGQTSGTNAGTYSAIFTPKDGYHWKDGTANAKSVSWQIKRQPTAITPTQSGTLTYTGNSLTPQWNNFDSQMLSISGETSAIAAGSYTAQFTPTSNYAWLNGGTETRAATWSIAQAERLTFTDKAVATSAWASDTTYADFPFRAAVPCTGVTESMFVQVVLAPEDATGGNFAPVCRSYTGGVYLYAKAAPEAEITIPTIVAWR